MSVLPSLQWEPPKPYAGQGVPLINSPALVVESACKLAKVHPNDLVCDVGCGLGGFCIHAASLGARAVGLDIREDYLESARRSAEDAGLGGRCSFQVCDFTHPDFRIPEGASVVFMYLLPWALELLRPCVYGAMEQLQGCRVVTFQFHPTGWLPQEVAMFGALKLFSLPCLKAAPSAKSPSSSSSSPGEGMMVMTPEEASQPTTTPLRLQDCGEEEWKQPPPLDDPGAAPVTADWDVPSVFLNSMD